VPLGEPLRERRLVEALPVVADGQDEVPVLLREAHADVARLRVLRDVGEKLPCRRQEQLLVRASRHGLRVKAQPETTAAGRPVPDRGERSLQTGRVEDVRVQLEQGLAQVLDGFLQRTIRPRQGGPVEVLGRLLQVVSRRQQVLDRGVVEGLGQGLPLALLGGYRLSHQPLALLR
jgi:hypothetical protein